MTVSLYNYHVFELNHELPQDHFLTVWVYVHADNIYIARALVYFYYYHIKDVTYIGCFDDIESIKPPEGAILDGYSQKTYDNFKIEYSFDFK